MRRMSLNIVALIKRARTGEGEDEVVECFINASPFLSVTLTRHAFVSSRLGPGVEVISFSTSGNAGYLCRRANL